MKRKYTVRENVTVKQAIEQMEKELIKAVVIVDDNDIVMGLFTNGDMRSFFLSGGKLSQNICEAMNKNPILYSSEEEVNFERKKIKRIIYPIVDAEKKLVSIIDFESNSDSRNISEILNEVPLVIMAGGKGTRLQPYTKILPKPLIPVGDYTITERIIDGFLKYGCNKVFMILNHKSSMIKAYMNDLDKTYDLEFLKEEDFFGTAGGLRLLKGKVDSTFFLSNCDVLINADYECIYKTHKEKGNKITFVCSMKDIEIPYGVVETNANGAIVDLNEKPGFSFLVNTGLYMLEPEVIDDIKDGEFIHMPDLAKRYIEKGEKVGVFPISDKSWMDMGQLSELEDMKYRLGVQ